MGPSEEGNASKRVFAGNTYLGTVTNSDMDPEEIAANAELMADAPALLNALRALCECTIADPEEDRNLTRRVFVDAERLLEKHGG
jgi:hypothetical protein